MHSSLSSIKVYASGHMYISRYKMLMRRGEESEKNEQQFILYKLILRYVFSYNLFQLECCT